MRWIPGFWIALPLLAHHVIKSEFDVDRTVTIRGVVIGMEWMNPHAFVYVDVTGDDGKINGWRLQGASPNALIRQGWKRDVLKTGDRVTVTGYPAKDGGPFAYVLKIVMPDGRELHVPDPAASKYWQQK